MSLGTTFGWRHADASLVQMLEDAGYSCELHPIRLGAAARLRRTIAMTDLVEALAARRAGTHVRARAVIYSSITAALLQSPRAPYAIRFDTVAALSRPGIMGLWQRLREPEVLSKARLLLPWSELAARTADSLLGSPPPASRPRVITPPSASRPRVITLPVPIERLGGSSTRDIDAIAYCANPPKRGLDLLCEAWRLAATPGARLIVGGIDRDRALRWLSGEARVQSPPGVEWAGDLSREEWLARVARARMFVNASRYEDWGIAQLEALSSGTPLVTVPSRGPFEALELARRLAPELVASAVSAPALAQAIAAGLSIGEAARDGYGAAAEVLLEPYRPETVRRIVTDDVAPALLRSSS